MRAFTIIFLLVSVLCSQVFCGTLSFPDTVKATLIFEEESTPKAHYPHILNAYLRLKNIHDGSLNWVCNPVTGIEAELLDSKGHPVPHPPSFASIQSNAHVYFLPFGSRLDWAISNHGGISMVGDLETNVALIIGRYGWLIPRDSLTSYSLKLRVKGLPWSRVQPDSKTLLNEILFDIPQTRITVQ